MLASFPSDIGGITKRGGGELILTASNSFSGPTRVEQGLLTINGALTRSALTAASGGTVGGTGTIASLTAQSRGIVSPGNAGAIGTLTVAGTPRWRRQPICRRFRRQRHVRPAGRQPRRAGRRDDHAAPAEPGAALWRQLYVLTTSGGVTGTFGDATSLSAILYPQLSYAANAVTASITRAPLCQPGGNAGPAGLWPPARR